MPELYRMIKLFVANKLVLNLDKSNITKFITNNSSHSKLHIGYKEKYVEETVNTKCLGLRIDNHIHWKNHIKQTIPKLSGAAVSILVTLTPSNKFTMMFAFYRKIWNNFVGNSSNSGETFTLQIKIFGIMADTHNPESVPVAARSKA